jgi:hypothetical protein
MWRSITNQNLERNLYQLYMWTDHNFSRRGFLFWLQDLVDWYSRYAGSSDVVVMMDVERP